MVTEGARDALELTSHDEEDQHTNGAVRRRPPARTHVRKHFGTDGIRGIANEHPMTPELALQLGRAVTFVAGRGKSHVPRVIIGKDTRLSGYMLEQAIASGVCAMGGRVMLCGPMPTPAIAHLTVSMRADAGIVISASHNPYQDNGDQGVPGGDGFKLPDEAESPRSRASSPTSASSASARRGPASAARQRIEDASGRYAVFPQADVSAQAHARRRAHRRRCGARRGLQGRSAGPEQELGALVTAIGVKPNGVNINKDAGALHPENIRGEVVKRGAAIGIALDGDADRVIVVDEKGQIVDGDCVLAMCAAAMVADDTLRKKTVVATVMSNLGLEHAMTRAGGKLVRTQVGDRYVVEAMRAGGFNLGGEQSGHLVFLDHASTGDRHPRRASRFWRSCCAPGLAAEPSSAERAMQRACRRCS